MIEAKDSLVKEFLFTDMSIQAIPFSLTLSLNNNFREKIKERNEKGGEGKEGKRNERKVIFICLGGKGREGKVEEGR